VNCANDIPYLGYHGLWILDILYANASLLVFDVRKLRDFNPSSYGGCHVPVANTSSMISSPFSISRLNQNLVFYNCIKAPVQTLREQAGLVETACRNNTFVRVGGQYGESGSIDVGYGLPGCSATTVPVVGAYRKVNASEYKELISD
jgi:hypothetical protein